MFRLGREKTQRRKTQKDRLYRGDIGLVIIAIEKRIGGENIRGSDDTEGLLRESRSDSPPDGLSVVGQQPFADRQRCDRKCGAAGHQLKKMEMLHEKQ